MDAWAAQLGHAVAFICVSCAGPELAFAFRQRLGLSACTNAYVMGKQYMPTWGQLGCGGFIVLDKDLRVVAPKTEAYLDVGGPRAFRDVEAVLASVLGAAQGDAAAASLAAAPEGEGEEQAGGRPVCTTGTCALQLNSGGEKPAEREQVAALGAVEATGVEAMDAQHEECAAALEALRRDRSAASLGSALECLLEHFAEEERLLDSTLYASAEASKSTGKGKQGDETEPRGDDAAPAGFSAQAGARKSHYADHRRLLRIAEEELAELESAESKDQEVAGSVIQGLLRGFEQHANRYDAAYAGMALVPASA